MPLWKETRTQDEIGQVFIATPPLRRAARATWQFIKKDYTIFLAALASAAAVKLLDKVL